MLILIFALTSLCSPTSQTLTVEQYTGTALVMFRGQFRNNPATCPKYRHSIGFMPCFDSASGLDPTCRSLHHSNHNSSDLLPASAGNRAVT